ncbi:MAG: NAD(+) diphosphatase [Acidimicrobiales bacterium]
MVLAELWSNRGVFEPSLVPPADPHDESLWFCVRRSEILIYEADGAPAVPSGPAAPPLEAEHVHMLGLLDGVPVWGIDVPAEASEPEGHRFVNLRSLYSLLPDQQWTLAGRAEQIVQWDQTHRFCGRCGEPTDRMASERARQCPKCKLMAFPRLTPAVIMLVEKGDEMLLAHGRLFPGKFYSALAGFVEPGETLEHAVEREVREETGIAVKDVKYFGSQPWPFPNSLMIGFNATYASGEIDIDPNEIVDAGWYTVDNLPNVPRGGMSIAGWLIQDFIERQERKAAGAGGSYLDEEEDTGSSLDRSVFAPTSEARRGSIWNRG